MRLCENMYFNTHILSIFKQKGWESKVRVRLGVFPSNLQITLYTIFTSCSAIAYTVQSKFETLFLVLFFIWLLSVISRGGGVESYKTTCNRITMSIMSYNVTWTIGYSQTWSITYVTDAAKCNRRVSSVA